MGKKILILDADVGQLSSVRQIFAREGFEVITATNIKTARRLLGKIDIDFFLMDVRSGIINSILDNPKSLK